jgi:TPR repeat protein
MTSILDSHIFTVLSEGVVQDDEEAVHWYHKAANQGHALAQFHLGLMYRDGKGVS